MWSKRREIAVAGNRRPARDWRHLVLFGEEPKLTRALPPQDGHLMSQRDELKLQRGAAANTERELGNEGGTNCDRAQEFNDADN